MRLNVLLLIIFVTSLNQQTREQLRNNIGSLPLRTSLAFSRKAKGSESEHEFRLQQSSGDEYDRREGSGPELSRRNLRMELSENSAHPARSGGITDQSTAEVNLIYSSTHEEDISEPLTDYRGKPNPLHQRRGVNSNSRLEVMKQSKQKTKEGMALFPILLISGGIAFIIIGVIVAVIVFIIIRKRIKARLKAKEDRIVAVKQPRKMESEDINRVKFQTAGPLVMDRKLTGPVKHALEDEHSVALKGVEFDVAQNEIIDIGSNIELIGNEKTTTEDSKMSQVAPPTAERKARTKPSTPKVLVRRLLSRDGGKRRSKERQKPSKGPLQARRIPSKKIQE